MPRIGSNHCLLAQPNEMTQSISDFLDPKSMCRLSAAHSQLNDIAHQNNRFWKDAFVKGVKDASTLRARQLAPTVPSIEAEHPNSKPPGHWKKRYRSEIHRSTPPDPSRAWLVGHGGAMMMGAGVGFGLALPGPLKVLALPLGIGGGCFGVLAGFMTNSGADKYMASRSESLRDVFLESVAIGASLRR